MPWRSIARGSFLDHILQLHLRISRRHADLLVNLSAPSPRLAGARSQHPRHCLPDICRRRPCTHVPGKAQARWAWLGNHDCFTTSRRSTTCPRLDRERHEHAKRQGRGSRGWQHQHTKRQGRGSRRSRRWQREHAHERARSGCGRGDNSSSSASPRRPTSSCCTCRCAGAYELLKFHNGPKQIKRDEQ